jgi:hypothetical protein
VSGRKGSGTDTLSGNARGRDVIGEKALLFPGRDHITLQCNDSRPETDCISEPLPPPIRSEARAD